MAGSDLRGRRKVFVDAYLGQCRGNATEAARAAGYAFPAQEGCRLLRQPPVKAEIEGRLAELGVTRESLLALLVAMLGFDMAEFLEFNGEGEPRCRVEAVEEPRPPLGIPEEPRPPGGIVGAGEDGQPAARFRMVGPTHLLKAVSAGRYGVRLEGPDKLKAITLLGRFLGMWGGREEEADDGFDEFARSILESAKKARAAS